MSGQVYFRYNIDKPLRRIGNYLPYFLLGIISPDFLASLVAPGTDAVEFRELQALNAKPLVIAKVPVESI